MCLRRFTSAIRLVGSRIVESLSAASLGAVLAAIIAVLFVTPLTSDAERNPLPPVPKPRMVRLPGHVLPALAKAVPVKESAQELRANGKQPITLTIVLRREHQAEFDRYRRELYDPHAPNFHRFLTQLQIADRFGPSAQSYAGVSEYFRARGFEVVAGSANRLTLTIRGTRRAAQRALSIRFADYRRGERRFFANDRDPMLPVEIAAEVESIVGLSNLALPDRPHTVNQGLPHLNEVPPCAVSINKTGGTSVTGGELACTCALASDADPSGIGAAAEQLGGISTPARDALNFQCAADELNLVAFYVANGGKTAMRAARKAQAGPEFSAPALQPGAGQKIGLLEFDNFHPQDVQDFLALIGSGANIANLSETDVGGGAGAPGGGEPEVLLDIDAVMALAPGAQVVVFDGPFSGPGSFQTMLNAMINAGVTVISNSWAYCEDQTDAADVNSLDSILNAAAVAGISVITGAGDTGATCLDGAANTIAVPADSPNITAVGGTTAIVNALGSYSTESYWDGSSSTPQSGSGGMGLSKFFARPNYQAGLNAAAMRSIPDVTAPADPVNGFSICEADAGGCPNNLIYGGTSLAAPIWAAMAAALNQQLGHNVGLLNPQIYPLANTGAFHSAASMGSDFAHVGLGSPNLNQIFVALSGEKVGAPSTANSLLAVAPDTVTADGASVIGVAVVLLDDQFNSVSGQTVTLAANAGSHAVITPINNVTNASNGAALFLLTDATPEALTLSASVGGSQLNQTQQVTFAVPPAVSASIVAATANNPADGATADTITVTLQDAKGNPTPGKVVSLDQGGGSSAIAAPSPAVTDSNGQIAFSVTDTHTEGVTYTATDITDGNLAVPGNAPVDFTNGAGGCANSGVVHGTANPASGYLVSTFASGFFVSGGNQGFSYNCVGAYGMAWDAAGNLYVSEWPSGKIFKFGASGGVADAAHLFATVKAPATGLAIDPAGNLFASEGSVSGANGDVVPVDLASGTVGAAIASGFPCLGSMALDPNIPALYVDDFCSSGPVSPNIWQITGIDSLDPNHTTTTVYAQTPQNFENFNLAVAPDGTVYDVFAAGAAGAPIAHIAPGSPPTLTLLTKADGTLISLSGGLGMTVGGKQPGGDAQSVIAPFDANADASGAPNDAVWTVDLSGAAPAPGIQLTTNDFSGLSNFAVGPDGCLYVASGPVVARVTNSAGTCAFGPKTQLPTIVLTPTSATPTDGQGSSQDFTATLFYAGAATGTPVRLSVFGPNTRILQANADSGQAEFSYTGTHSGVDTVVASAFINNTVVTSNSAQVTWNAGKDVTALGLNQAPSSAMPQQAVTVSGQLSDISQSPPAPVPNQQITFAIGSGNCPAVTDTNGIASCQLTPSGNAIAMLTADFAGTNALTASHAQSPFSIVQPAAGPTPVPGRLRIAPRRVNFGAVTIGANKTRTVTIWNLGRITKKTNAVPITIELETASSPAAPSPFSVTMQCPPNDPLVPRAKRQKPGKCQVHVQFAPLSAEAFTGTLSIFDNLEPNLVQTVPLSGRGKAPPKRRPAIAGADE